MSGFSLRIYRGNVQFSVNITEEYDNVFFEDGDTVFVLEGLILNKSRLMQQYAASGWQVLLKKLFQEKRIKLLKELEGEFRGFIYDKKKLKVYAFTNPTSTQSIFYSSGKFGLLVDTSLIRLNETLCSFEKTSPNMDAMYQLLAVGNMLEDTTPIQGVSKLLDGCYIETDTEGNFQVNEYYSAASGQRFGGTIDSAIDHLHEVFDESVNLEYQKDADLNSKHLALLSGGLDSRIALFSAIKQNFKNVNTLCFSQSGYFDHSISKNITNDFGLPYEFVPLDGGGFLKAIDQVTEIGEGMTVFSGAPHVFHATNNLQFQDFKIFHSGQIGDGVLGGFNSVPQPAKPSNFKIIEDTRFLPKINGQLREYFKKHETEESFLLRNIAFNRTVLGAKVFQKKAIQTSPFMTRNFMSLAMSLPEKWKFKHKFYLSWIARHYPEATKYRWERTLLKPDAPWKVEVGDQVVKRFHKILFARLLKIPRYASMYPYQLYFDKSASLQEYYDLYFRENFHRLENYKELADDVGALYQFDEFFHKAKALHILAVFKLYFK